MSDEKHSRHSPVSLQSAAVSDVGLERSRNEDAVFYSQEKGLFILADGMGGAGGGDIASSIAVEEVKKIADRPSVQEQDLKSALESANRKIFRRSKDDNIPGMGSTVVSLLFDENRANASIFYAGDSRVYLLRNGKLRRLTEDHSLKEELKKKMGCDTADLPNISLIEGRLTKALGLEENIVLDKREIFVKRGDQFLLCSDGLTKKLDDARIQYVLGGGQVQDALAEKLVEEAKAGGGEDNISVILVKLVRSLRFLARKIAFVLAFLLICLAVVFTWQAARGRRIAREIRALTESAEKALTADLEVTEAELSFQMAILEQMISSLPEKEHEALLLLLEERTKEFFRRYEAVAVEALDAHDWATLDALPPITSGVRQYLSSNFDLGEEVSGLIRFSREKNQLQNMWWRLTRLIRDGNFSELSGLSRDYAGIVMLITTVDPVIEIAGLQFLPDDNPANAEMLLENWPFSERYDRLRQPLEAMLEGR